MAELRICSIFECGKPHKARGWCKLHYDRWMEHGDPFFVRAKPPIRICSIEGCERPVRAKDWCHSHYNQAHKRGTPYLTLQGIAQEYFARVVMPYRGQKCLLWPLDRTKSGYGRMWLSGRSRTVHSVVCKAIHGDKPSPRHQVAHTCGKGFDGCVNPQHLRWATARENSADRTIHGTQAMGSGHPMAKLDEAQVLLIRAMEGKMSGIKVAEKFGVSKHTVYKIYSRKVWKCI